MAKLEIRKNVPLAELTTFKVGGYAKYLAEVKNKDELLEAVTYAKENSLPIFVLGGGSDILISDRGFDGLVLKFVGKKIEFKNKGKNVIVTASGGAIWDDLVKASVLKELWGIECLSGIPGTVGAAPIQNIGAYGQELKDVFVRLSAYDFKKGKFVTMTESGCKFGYRESIFKKLKNRGRYVITDITLKLTKAGKPTLTYESLKDYLESKRIKNPSISQLRDAVLLLRGQKLDDPQVLGNAGSFFKNPHIDKKVLRRIQKQFPQMPFYPVNSDIVKLFAGWLIENAGWKGKKYKNAQVSNQNALVITNPGGRATAKEVKELSERIGKDVYKKFKIHLEPEVQFIGFDK